MKYVWRIAFLALILVPVAHVHADVAMVKKHTSNLRAFENLKSRLANLESYSVVYVDASSKKQEVLKSAPARQSKKDDVTVELRPKRKS